MVNKRHLRLETWNACQPKILPPEALILRHRQEDVIDALKRGELEHIRYDQKWPADELVRFALHEGFLQEGLRSFPDPMKNWEEWSGSDRSDAVFPENASSEKKIGS